MHGFLNHFEPILTIYAPWFSRLPTCEDASSVFWPFTQCLLEISIAKRFGLLLGSELLFGPIFVLRMSGDSGKRFYQGKNGLNDLT
ncbi:hypothetical [Prochlorococcus marinus str. MIT 9313]|uniref:Uncharacterized protein n=1 Tax=Prochlorococcus marinus (strain MIT 9313) TaxID=74547 RepID=Q7V8N1_PROMM|nr:hypothetical [Prochlorococcus marinus str. MIT 9313]